MRTVLIDDEMQIRQGLEILLKKYTEVDIIGEADSVQSAKLIIEKEQPELVFLDIQLKNETGFDLLDKLNFLDFHLIFVTAYNEFAIKAFKYNAFDYLLKPVNPKELKESLNRVQLKQSFKRENIDVLRKNRELKKLVIPTKEELFVLKVDEIIRCFAVKGYTFFYMEDGREIISSKTMKEYEKILPENQFIRVHQSHMVNLKYVQSYDKSGTIILTNNAQIPVSVRRRKCVSDSLRRRH